jgi:hypothetical protein
MFNYDHNYRNHYKQPDRTELMLSATNFANNFPWGDDAVLPKPPTTFCQYYQNVNGIKLDNTAASSPQFALRLTICKQTSLIFAKRN